MMRLLVFLNLAVLTSAILAGEPPTPFAEKLALLEQDHGGRLGVAALDTASGDWMRYRADERFAMASTFKVLLAAAVLARVDAGHKSLERMVKFGPPDLLSYAPVTSKNVAAGKMTVAELCAAAVEVSDNTAANLLLETLGGPGGVTDYLRSLGDTVTRLDRNEPSLNTNLPGDERDTTSPAAVVTTLEKLLVGEALSPASRQRLTAWMVACTTGADKLRAGLDPSWKVGDKTGSGENGASNDIAIVWPPDRPPFLIAVYYSGSTAGPEQKNAVVAAAGRAVATAFHPEKSGAAPK